MPVGKHDAVAQKLAYIAATAFGLEAMLDVSSRLADDKKNDIRIEAAIAKLYASENGWQVLDDLMQIRGGRGYETAQSLKDRGEKPVPVEAALRDMRINRIFEGSTEIMHLLIAREAVDQHLQVAGEILEGDGDLSTKAKAAVGAGKFYAKWLPGLTVGEGLKPGSYDEFGSLATHLRFVERHSRKLARTTFYAMGRWQAKLEKKQAFLGRIVDIGAELYAIASAAVVREHDQDRAPGPRRAGLRARRPVLQAGPLARRPALRRALVQRRRRQLRRRAGRARRPLHVGRGGRRGPVGRRADDRLPARLGRRARGEHLSDRPRTLSRVPAPRRQLPKAAQDIPWAELRRRSAIVYLWLQAGWTRADAGRARAGPQAAREVARAAEPALPRGGPHARAPRRPRGELRRRHAPPQALTQERCLTPFLRYGAVPSG